MDHYRNPRHRSPVPEPDIQAHELNPFCGDEVILQIKLDSQGRVAAVSSVSQGCSIIQASASMMADVMVGETLDQLAELSQRFRRFMQGDEHGTKELGDLKALQVVRQYPVRIKCALLPWVALEEGINQASS